MQCTQGVVPEGEYLVEVCSVPQGLCQRVCGGGMQCTQGVVSEGEYMVEVCGVPEGLCQRVSAWWRCAVYPKGCVRG